MLRSLLETLVVLLIPGNFCTLFFQLLEHDNNEILLLLLDSEALKCSWVVFSSKLLFSKDAATPLSIYTVHGVFKSSYSGLADLASCISIDNTSVTSS
jgi:hypothetical protein